MTGRMMGSGFTWDDGDALRKFCLTELDLDGGRGEGAKNKAGHFSFSVHLGIAWVVIF